MSNTIQASTQYVEKMLKRIKPHHLKLGLLNRVKTAIKGIESSDKKTPKETIRQLVSEVFTDREMPKVKEFLNGFISL